MGSGGGHRRRSGLRNLYRLVVRTQDRGGDLGLLLWG